MSSSSNNNKITLQQLLDVTTHVVVDFRNYGKSCLALVPRSWLSEAKATWHCQYPKGLETETVEEEYVRVNTAPEENWPKFKVKILQEASSYEQGKRRLDRLLEGKNAYASNLGMFEKMPTFGVSGINNEHGKTDKNGNGGKSSNSNKPQKGKKGDENPKHNKADKPMTKKSRNIHNHDDQGDQSGGNDDPVPSSDDENSDRSNVLQDSSHGTRSVSSDAAPIETDKNDSTASSSGQSLSSEDVGRSTKNEKKPSAKSQRATNRPPSAKCHNIETKKPNPDGRHIDIKKEIADAMMEMQEKLYKKFERLNKACINEIKYQFRDLKEAVVPAESLRAVGNTLNECKALLDVSLPIEDIAEFLRLETALADKKETKEALKKYMRLMQNGCKTMADSLAKILPAIMAKPVQLQYSGKGRVVKGKSKLNFSSTEVFSAMSELLIELHSCNPNQVSSRTGKWLAGAGDRDGGKRQRDLEARLPQE